jgi:Lhr-like helicase
METESIKLSAFIEELQNSDITYYLERLSDLYRGRGKLYLLVQTIWTVAYFKQQFTLSEFYRYIKNGNSYKELNNISYKEFLYLMDQIVNDYYEIIM